MSFERIGQRIHEELGDNATLDDIINKFPTEMHEDLDREIESLSDDEAIVLLKERLARRREALATFTPDMIPEGIEKSDEVPLAFIRSVEVAEAAGDENYIGAGQNGKFLRSIREPSTGYKILFNEQAKRTGANIVREVVMQYNGERILRDLPNAAKIPKIWRYVKTKDIQAIRMDLINGESLAELMKQGVAFPASFDPEVFFEKLMNAVVALNEAGLHHRDLTNNHGNVMVDTEGNPWIIDFGSATEASPDPEDSNRYQERPGAPVTIGTDQQAVLQLKEQVLAYIRKREKNHE